MRVLDECTFPLRPGLQPVTSQALEMLNDRTVRHIGLFAAFYSRQLVEIVPPAARNTVGVIEERLLERFDVSDVIPRKV